MASSLIKFASASLVAFTQYAAAADFTFSGNIRYHNDVVRVDFTLNTEATDVRVWTDSFNDGENFDPITAVWTLPTGALVGENDDDDTIGPNQTYFDSGLTFASLPAGSYAFTITPYDNFAPDNLFKPFGYANETPIPIGAWCQPASDDCLNQKGTFWRVRLSGVDSATPPVPEPSTYGLLLAGLLATVAVARQRRR
jgi:PEP-CTERM motif